MKYTLLEKLDKKIVSQIIERAWEFEARRDVDGAIRNFAPIWSNIEKDPDFSEFEHLQQAQLYRLSGFFLSIYGNVRNRKNYQERAKDLLCQSIEIFTLINDSYGIADAQNVLAVCYLNEGAILEAEAILQQTARELLGNHLHPAYLRNRNNLLHVTINKKNFQESLEIIEENLIPIEFCDDLRVCCLFHEKAGLVYRGLKQYDKAIWHYHESIKFAHQLDNLLFVSSQKNNLAFLYNKIRNFELAHQNIGEAIRLAQDNNFLGALPSYLDTQALIFANEGCLEIALKTIDEAISLFEKSDDFYNLTDSIWNKCKFLLLIDRKEEAIFLFTQMVSIANQAMGEFAVHQFTKEFSELIHIKREGSGLDEELKRFKRIEIVNAIREANFNLIEAAETLKIDIAILTKTLDKEFPELYKELDLQHFKSFEVGDGGTLNSQLATPRKISQLILKEVEITFESNAPGHFSTFYIAAEKLPEALGLTEDIVLAVNPIFELAPDKFVIVFDKHQKVYSVGQVQFDQVLDLYYILDKNGEMPIFLNDVELVGTAFGFCPFAEMDKCQIHFELIPF